MTVILTYDNYQIKVLNEDDQNKEESLKPSAEKTREARSAVREALREKRKELRELRKGMKEGRELLLSLIHT